MPTDIFLQTGILCIYYFDKTNYLTAMLIKYILLGKNTNTCLESNKGCYIMFIN